MGALIFVLVVCALTKDSGSIRAGPGTAESAAWKAALTEAYRALNARRFDQLIEPMDMARRFTARFPTHRYAAKTVEYRALEMLYQFRYAEATREYLRAKEMALAAGDRATAASVMHSLSNIYFQAENLDGARQAAEQAIQTLPERTLPLLRGHLRNHYARTLARAGRFAEAEKIFAEVIEMARREKLTVLGAEVWKLASREHSLRGELDQARRAIHESIRIRTEAGDPELASDYYDLADIELRAGQPREALQWLGRGAPLAARSTRFAAWRIDVARGRARLALGDTRGALEDLRRAERSRRQSRTFLLPGDWLRSHSNPAAEDPYALLVEAAIAEHRRTGAPALLSEAFAASEARRAWTLRSRGGGGGNSGLAVPPAQAARYWQTVGEFDVVYAKLREAGDGQRDRAAERRLAELRLALAELEATFDTGIPSDDAPSNVTVQPGEALIALQLGERQSWAWSVTAQPARLAVTPLPGRAFIEELATAWQTDLASREKAAMLGRVLLGGLPAAVIRAPKWLVAADGVLFGVPLAALPLGDGNLVVERHSVQLVPGSWALGRRHASRRSGVFLGVGDPVYNEADPRLDAGPAGSWRRWFGWRRRGESVSSLTRLAGSGAEVESCSRKWPWAETLTGSRATPQRFAEALAGSSYAAIHLAVHVVPAPDKPQENLIALSSDGLDGHPAYAGPEWIGARRVHDALVVMNGCRSGSGTVTAEGLMGLSRAWLRAGASRVLSTYWPTNDDAGTLAREFYGQLITQGLGHAEALRRAQLAMRDAGGWKADPKHWSAYFLMGYPE